MKTTKRVDKAENQHQQLTDKLSELQTSSQRVAMEAAELVKRKKDLEIELRIKKDRKERLLAQKPFITDVELLQQMIDEVQASVDGIEKHIALLKMKIEEQNAEEERLKEDIAKKQKEVEESNRSIQASKKKCSLLQSKLKAERMVFDFKLRQQLQSSEKIQEELKVYHNSLLVVKLFLCLERKEQKNYFHKYDYALSMV